ncbi:hypothetical protein [Paenibacillus koleovorans]|uniref:hypothetical protein n=1 Tax=Paenibacillus koleovorans TaxID=121608 RepID=UPI000FD771A6|nr:hypothetical protein [Paenibacillus koleovorans]
MTFELTDWMLYGMWLVLGLMGLDFLLGLYKSFKTNTFSHTLILGYLQDMLFYILPLFLLSNMMSLDHTDWLIKVGYYVGIVGVALKYLMDMKKKM